MSDVIFVALFIVLHFAFGFELHKMSHLGCSRRRVALVAALGVAIFMAGMAPHVRRALGRDPERIEAVLELEEVKR